MTDRWDDLRKRTRALRLELPESVANDYCPRVFDLLAERDDLAAENALLRGVVDEMWCDNLSPSVRGAWREAAGNRAAYALLVLSIVEADRG